MIYFKKLIVEGFGSFNDPEQFEITPGLHLVKGKNGHGKTTLFSALYWCIYGSNLKEVTNAKVATWEELRTEQWRGTRVFLDFETEDGTRYSIARHLNFKGTTKGVKGDNTLMLLKNGERDNAGLHKADVQANINRIMGMDSRIFINSVLFGQRMTRLIQASDADKRKVFDDLFELSFVPKAKEFAKDEAIKYNTKKLSCENKIDSSLGSIELLQQEHDRVKHTMDNFEASKQADIDLAKTTLDNHKTDKEEILKDLEKLEPQFEPFKDIDFDKVKQEYDAKRDEVEDAGLLARNSARKLSNYNTEIQAAEDRITKMETDLENVETNCPTCSAPLKKTEVNAAKKKIKEAIAAEKDVITSLKDTHDKEQPLVEEKQKKVDSLKSELEVLDNAIKNRDTYLTLVSNRDMLNTRLESKESMIATQEKAIENIKARKLNIKKPLASYLEDIAKLQEVVDEEKEKLIVHKDNFDAYNWWDKKGFSNSGIKSFVFNSMLNKLNNHIHSYTSKLGLLVRFSVDLSKASKPFKTEVLKDNIVVDYDELSGGQKQRLDICLAFAMFDIVSNNQSFNILILDELLEGLDDEGVEEVFGIIRSKVTTDRGIYLITHQNNVDTHSSRELWVKFDGITSYIEYYGSTRRYNG